MNEIQQHLDFIKNEMSKQPMLQLPFSVEGYELKTAQPASPGGSAIFNGSVWLVSRDIDVSIGILTNSALVVTTRQGCSDLLGRYFDLATGSDEVSEFDSLLLKVGSMTSLAPLDAIILLQKAVSPPLPMAEETLESPTE
jgi:hypothetical protein